MNIAVIKISPENVNQQMEVQTNGVGNLEILESLNVLVKYFAKAIVKEAQEIGCAELDDFEGYIQFLRKNKL
jgi:hypothetical protein